MSEDTPNPYMHTIITTEKRTAYGQDRTYVVGKHAKAIQHLTGKKTLSWGDIDALTSLGFQLREKYNGHPSYEHWNAALWVCNDEELYGLARDTHTPEEFQAVLQALTRTYNEVDVPVKTGDGVEMTPELLAYAWASIDDERQEDK